MIRSFIIRLDGNVISEKYSLDCALQAKKFNIEVEFFKAINGNEYQQHLRDLKIFPKYKFKKERAGVFGCFLSHYYLWKKCLEENVSSLILEHDGYFIRPLPENILDQFDDVLKLDPYDPYEKKYNDNILLSENTIDVQITNYYNNKAKGDEKIGTGNYLRGAYGYIIKPHAAEKLISWINSNGFLPADQQIGNNITDIKVVTPGLIRLHPDYFNRIKELSLTGNPELLDPVSHVRPTSSAS